MEIIRVLFIETVKYLHYNIDIILFNITELESVISFSAHKSIYRHLFLWLEIDLGLGVLKRILRNWNRRHTMLALERQNIILKHLASSGVITTKRLSELTGASLATLRRDLNYMDSQGMLKKTHGGAQSLQTAAVRPNASVPLDFDPFLEYKVAIARKAAEFIDSGDIIFIGAGMTCNLLCRHLNESGKENITIVTTNITGIMEVAQNPNISTLLLGGSVHAGVNHLETLDEYTVQTLEKLYFNKVFITVDGIDMNYGYSIINRAQLPLYNHLIQNSYQVYLFANEGKFNKRTFTLFCGLDEVPNVITNSCIDPKYLLYYKEHGISVFTV